MPGRALAIGLMQMVLKRSRTLARTIQHCARAATALHSLKHHRKQAPPRRLRVGISASDLGRLAQRVLERSVAEPGLDHLDLELPSVTEAIADIRRRLEVDIESDFDHLTSHLDRPIQLVAYFLAMLELARWGLVEARQTDARSPIILRRTAAPAGSLVSEWDT